jgi:hypothetical protein
MLLMACSSELSGSQEPPTPTLSTLDGPCTLLTRQEVGSVTSSRVISVDRGISKLTNKPEACLYRTNGPYGAIVVDLTRDDADDFHARLADESAKEFPNVELVPGLGDEAALYGRTSLVVLLGDDVLSLGTQFYELDGPAVLRSLAAIAVTRI